MKISCNSVHYCLALIKETRRANAMTNLIQRLQPFVTTFSASLKGDSHGETVTVGGKVTAILNMTDFGEGIYVTLDDSVGEVETVLSPKAYELYVKHSGELKKGDEVLVEGKVMRLDTSHSYNDKKGKKVTVDKHKTETVRVLAYQIAPLPKDKVKKVKAKG
jgi:aspartyl-tRNA synthetase